ncbi:solute carrier family 12 member 1-like, partial [Actinia tenebrosa]|uniref:Solute carrier family 12 member 9 n=1 Tax=Actinia tenebrosa TaxID=6105 RepID=A0A6P8J1F5_ACTTE
MAEQVNDIRPEGELEDKPTETKKKATPETQRNDRFKVRQVGFTGSENPSTNEAKEKKDGIEHQEDVNESGEKPFEPQSPHHENFTQGYATNEALPMTVFYRNTSSQTPGGKHRPTLQELRKGLESDSSFQPLVEHSQDDKSEDDQQLEIKSSTANAPKFGWIKGVLFGCLLNIWGVMLYLRLSWVVGQAGIGMATVIILLSAVVTTLTTLSMSAICTNGEVKGGGAYFLISRSLGPEFGGSIGVIFSIANAVAIAMYVVGFAETVRDLLRENNALMVDEVNDIRIIGLITVVVLFVVAIVGLQWVVRTQIVLLAILIISIFNVLIGSIIGPQNAESQAKGFVGYNKDAFYTNMKPDFVGEGFFSVFAVFFPAATGILAGVNISGDLKNVNSAIPKGTLLAIVISSLVYILLAWVVGATYIREATGIVAAGLANTTLANKTEALSCLSSDRRYGLLNDFQ